MGSILWKRINNNQIFEGANFNFIFQTKPNIMNEKLLGLRWFRPIKKINNTPLRHSHKIRHEQERTDVQYLEARKVTKSGLTLSQLRDKIQNN